MCVLFCKLCTDSLSSFHSSPVPRLFFHSVLGGMESRGVLRKISDMLEVILKRMDSLSKLDNTSTSDARRLDELSSAINRYAEFFFFFIFQFFIQFLCVNVNCFHYSVHFPTHFLSRFLEVVLSNSAPGFLKAFQRFSLHMGCFFTLPVLVPVKPLTFVNA